MIRIVFFILTAIGLGGFGTVAWIATRPASTTAPKQTVWLLSAGHDLTAGSLLKPDDLGTVAQDAITKDLTGTNRDSPATREALVGAMLLHGLHAGAPIRDGDLLRPGDRGFLAAALAPDMRAVTVGVDAITGAAGLIWPGDRVDLILTQNLAVNQADPHRISAETVLSNVRVIAIDRLLVQSAPSSDAPQARTATLEVSQTDAERVSVATRLGRLSLAVMSSRAGTAPSAPAKPVLAGDVSPLLRDPPPQLPSGLHHGMVLYQGDARQEIPY